MFFSQYERQSYKTAKTAVLYILPFKFLNWEKNDEGFWTEW